MSFAPEVLYRITTPKLLRIKNNYIQPHSDKSEYGLSLPLAIESELLFIAGFFASETILQDENSNHFLLLHILTSKLKNIKARPPHIYGEYFAQIPRSAINKIGKYAWIPQWQNDKNARHLSTVTEYLGDQNLEELDALNI